MNEDLANLNDSQAFLDGIRDEAREQLQLLVFGRSIKADPPEPEPPASDYLTPEEAADYIRRSVKTLYNLRSLGKLKPLPSGLYTVEELKAYLNRSKPRKGRKPTIR